MFRRCTVTDVLVKVSQIIMQVLYTLFNSVWKLRNYCIIKMGVRRDKNVSCFVARVDVNGAFFQKGGATCHTARGHLIVAWKNLEELFHGVVMLTSLTPFGLISCWWVKWSRIFTKISRERSVTFNRTSHITMPTYHGKSVCKCPDFESKIIGGHFDDIIFLTKMSNIASIDNMCMYCV